jgi:integrase/recombinase XerD
MSDALNSGVEIAPAYEEDWKKYCDFLENDAEKTGTFEQWRSGTKRWFNWCAENGVGARSVTDDEVVDFIRDTNHLAEHTRASAFTAILALYSWWIEGSQGLSMEQNPCTDVELGKYVDRRASKYFRILSREGKKDLKAPSRATIEALFEYASEPGSSTELRNETLLRLMWDTAARCDEIRRMREDSIDWEKQSIEIRSSKLKSDQDLYHRRVFFSDTTKRFLRLWCDGGREAYSLDYADSEYIFITNQNPQMRSSHISRIVKEAAMRHDEAPETDEDIQLKLYTDAAGNSRWLMTGHRIRHARISYLCNDAEMRLNNIRMMAGHQKLETTMDYITTDWETVRDDFHENAH